MRQASAVTQCTTANVHSAGRQRVTRELVIGPRFYADPLGLTPPYKTCRKSSPVHPTVRNALSDQESSRGLRLETPKSPGRRKTCTTQVGGLGARKVRGRLRFYVAPKQQPPCSLQRSGICSAARRRGVVGLLHPGWGHFDRKIIAGSRAGRRIAVGSAAISFPGPVPSIRSWRMERTHFR